MQWAKVHILFFISIWFYIVGLTCWCNRWPKTPDCWKIGVEVGSFHKWPRSHCFRYVHLHELGHMQVICVRTLHNTNKNEVSTFVYGPLHNEETEKLHYMYNVMSLFFKNALATKIQRKYIILLYGQTFGYLPTQWKFFIRGPGLSFQLEILRKCAQLVLRKVRKLQHRSTSHFGNIPKKKTGRWIKLLCHRVKEKHLTSNLARR